MEFPLAPWLTRDTSTVPYYLQGYSQGVNVASQQREAEQQAATLALRREQEQRAAEQAAREAAIQQQQQAIRQAEEDRKAKAAALQYQGMNEFNELRKGGMSADEAFERVAPKVLPPAQMGQYWSRKKLYEGQAQRAAESLKQRQETQKALEGYRQMLIQQKEQAELDKKIKDLRAQEAKAVAAIRKSQPNAALMKTDEAITELNTAYAELARIRQELQGLGQRVSQDTPAGEYQLQPSYGTKEGWFKTTPTTNFNMRFNPAPKTVPSNLPVSKPTARTGTKGTITMEVMNNYIRMAGGDAIKGADLAVADGWVAPPASQAQAEATVYPDEPLPQLQEELPEESVEPSLGSPE